MSAYNWVSVKGVCPKCEQAKNFRFQTHVASSFSGDAGGFHGHVYEIGEKMRWFDVAHTNYNAWPELAELMADGTVVEQCLAECGNCHAQLEATISFKDQTPQTVSVLRLSRDNKQ